MACGGSDVPITMACGDLLSDFVCEANLQAKTLQILEGMDKENAALCRRLFDELLLCKKGISNLKDVLKIQKQGIAELKAMSTRCEELNKYMDHIENNIPEHFTYIPDGRLEGDDTKLKLAYDEDDGDDSKSQNSISSGTLFAGSFIQSQMGNIEHSSFEEEDDTFELRIPSQDPKLASKATDAKYCPTVAYLTQEEFDSIPSYMKGRTRLTLDSVNIFIRIFNTALTKKYKIVSQLASNLSRLHEKQLHRKYMKQDILETKGMYFLTKEDIMDSDDVKMLSTVNLFNSLTSILRARRRTFEVRKEMLTRFVLITDTNEQLLPGPSHLKTSGQGRSSYDS